MVLTPLIINGVAHGLAVKGQTFILCCIDLVPVPQGLVQMAGVDPDQDITDDNSLGTM